MLPDEGHDNLKIGEQACTCHRSSVRRIGFAVLRESGQSLRRLISMVWINVELRLAMEYDLSRCKMLASRKVMALYVAGCTKATLVSQMYRYRSMFIWETFVECEG